MLAIKDLSDVAPAEGYPLESAARDYERIGMALRTIEEFGEEAGPDLTALAAAVGLSPHHFQRLFRRWVGVSPKRFIQALTLKDAKARLAASESVLDAAFGAGLSGPGRLHDLFVACEAMTPGEYKAKGRELEIVYGFHPSPFGECLIMTTERGVCGLGFVVGTGEAARRAAFEDLSGPWRLAHFAQDDTQDRCGGAPNLCARTQTQHTDHPFSQRHQLSNSGLASAAAHSAGLRHHLRGDRKTGRPAKRGARRRRRHRAEPNLLDHPLPPRDPQKRRIQSLPLGP